MPDLQPVIVVARQAGSANAFMPVIDCLQIKAVPFLLLAFADAYQIWKAASLTVVAINSFEQAQTYLTRYPRALALLTGTSFAAVDDALFWRWAQRQHIPCVAFVDHWSNYAQRFSSQPDEGLCFDLLPDAVAVIDRVAEKNLIKAGCPRSLVHVTGHPVFERLTNSSWPINTALRQRYLKTTEALLWLFVSEPFEPFYGPAEANVLGFTEVSVLTQLLPALERLGQCQKQLIHVLLKPHPMELQYNNLRQLCAGTNGYRWLRVDIVDEPDRHALIAACDGVLGMTSLLLYEAMLMRRPVLSLQFNRKQRCDLTDDRAGIRVVTDVQALAEVLSLYFVEARPGVSRCDDIVPEPVFAVRRLLQLLNLNHD